MSRADSEFVRAASVIEVEKRGCLTVHVAGQTVAIFAHDDHFFAVDNRCPHMGFPLDRGTVGDGILTCHWHHARFDLESGGTFDLWADDVRSFPLEIRDDEIWVDVSEREDPFERQRRRLLAGLERNIPLVIGKAVLKLAEQEENLREMVRDGVEFGAGFRLDGWGSGLTVLSALVNVSPFLRQRDRPQALYHGLSAVAADTIGSAPRFGIWPLPDEGVPVATLRRWFRRFVEVRDAEGAERCLVSAVASGADDMQMADMLFAAATDHRYLQSGHVVDFTNKAFEVLDVVGWEYAGTVLTSLARAYANAERMEEANAWRNPEDLVKLLEDAFERLPAALAAGCRRQTDGEETWSGRQALVAILLSDSPQTIVEALLQSLNDGASCVEIASAVSYAAALRIARFHTSNEFSDWDTALHTFTYANAVEQGLRRAPSTELVRGVFDAAMSVYLDRFLNIPAAALPRPEPGDTDPGEILAQLAEMLDRQQQVNEAGSLVAHYLSSGGELDALLAEIGRLLLREDRDFHTIQTIEAALRQVQFLRDKDEIANVLVAAVRYLAAHTPTVRAQGQTYLIAQRLHRGEELFA